MPGVSGRRPADRSGWSWSSIVHKRSDIEPLTSLQHALCLRLLRRIGRRINELRRLQERSVGFEFEAHPRDIRICVGGLSRRLPTRDIGLDYPRVEARLLRGGHAPWRLGLGRGGRRGRSGRQAHRHRSSGLGRRNRCGSRRSVLDERLGPEAVVDEDARGKRCEERHGHDECRFHGHGKTVVDLAERVLTMCFTRIEIDNPSKKRLELMKDKDRRDYTLNSTTRGPTKGVQFTSASGLRPIWRCSGYRSKTSTRCRRVQLLARPCSTVQPDPIHRTFVERD